MTAHALLMIKGSGKAHGRSGPCRMGKISNFYSGREGEHEGKLWGKTTENDTSKHMEPGEQGVCGREHRLSTTVSSYVMCHGFVQFLLTLQKRE